MPRFLGVVLTTDSPNTSLTWDVEQVDPCFSFSARCSHKQLFQNKSDTGCVCLLNGWVWFGDEIFSDDKNYFPGC